MSDLTPLEKAVLTLYHARYQKFGFPEVGSIKVVQREHTGVGRYTKLEHSGDVRTPDGELFLGKFSHIEIDGVAGGATVSVDINGGKVMLLEILCVGDHGWDGTERSWKILDPEKGGDFLTP